MNALKAASLVATLVELLGCVLFQADNWYRRFPSVQISEKQAVWLGVRLLGMVFVALLLVVLHVAAVLL